MEDLSQVLKPINELLLATPLNDKSLMASDNPIALKTDQSYPVTLADVTFTFGAGADADVMLFNDEDDKDPDGLLSVKNTPLVFDTASEAFLKYTNEVSAKANGAETLKNIGFNVDLSASGSAKTIFYKKHNNAETINAAFLGDIKSFKTIFREEDLQNLEVGNALGFTVNGTLSASLKVSWSNIFSQSLSVVSKLFPAPLTLDINITPSFTASFSVSITDNFSYVIIKEAGDQCLVNFSRKKSNSVSGSVGVNVVVGFADPADVQKQLTAIYDKICTTVFGLDSATISDAITKWKQNISDTAQNGLVVKLLKYFKLDTTTSSAETLLSKLSALQQKVTGVISDIANASVQASFTYQYERLEENDTVLSAGIATADLLKYHGQLLRFTPAVLLDDMRNNVIQFTLHSFLQQSVLTVTSSYGFGFKLFDLANLTSKDYVDDKVSKIFNIEGGAQIKVDRTRGYQWQSGKAKGSWLGDFSAAMVNFSVAPTPSIKDFGFNLLAEMVTVDPNMGINDLQSYLDAGALWGSVRGQDILALSHKYADAGILGKPVSVDVKLTFSGHALALLLQQVAAYGWGGLNIQYLAKAMAASMTWLSGYQWRSAPEIRQAAYYPLWYNFLTNYDPSADISDFGAEAEDRLQKAGAPDYLAQFEGTSANWPFGDSFAGVIRSNPGVYDDLKDAVLSLIALQQMVQAQQAFDLSRLQSSMDGFMKVFSQSFYTRTIGNFLLQHALGLTLGDDIKTVLTFTVGTGDKAQTISIAAS